MADRTKIEWTRDDNGVFGMTWNPLAGCTWASPGCDHCYAAVMARRLDAMAQADLAAGRDPGQKRKYIGITNKNKAGRIMFNGKVNLDYDAINEPLSWRKPRRVFVNSMSDLFHKDVPDSFIDQVFGVMAATPQHTYQVLTKRPERAAEYLNGYGRDTLVWIEAYSANPTYLLKHNKPAWPLPNVWIGTSVENQEQADERIPHLLKAPAAVRFLSCEPLLGPVDLVPWLFRPVHNGAPADLEPRGDLHWLIAGGESGANARPMHPDWARSLRDQCSAAGVAYFMKQMGSVWAKENGLGGKGGEWAGMPEDLRIREVPDAI